MTIRRLALAPILVLLVGCPEGGGGGPADRPSGMPASVAQETASPTAEGGEVGGFVVWESNRSGTWRLWTRPLQGGDTRPLTGEEPDRWQCCAHIAPDGRRIAWMSLPPGRQEYPRDAPEEGRLLLLDLATGSSRRLADRARTYLEHRAAVWRDDGALLFIDGEGYSTALDLATGERRRLIDEPSPDRGWLFDPTLRFATTGLPTFAPYDARRRRIAERPRLPGCQPYFSQDGRWGYWMAGAGGPIERRELTTGETGTILAKSDPRLPADRGYLYFPMFSRDGRLFVFGASGGEHDQWKADYDIFAAASDPELLAIVGPIRRITDDPSTDRFPDGFVEPLSLGWQRGEAPLTVRFEAPEGEGWEWTFGDGGTAVGKAASHTYETPGSFRVEARSGATVLRGAVQVEAGRPPEVVGARLRGAGAEILVDFDEPVEIADLAASLASGDSISSWRSTADGRTLILEPSAPVRRPDLLRLSGVVDRSAARRPLEETEIRLEPPLWPVDREGLVFLWRTANAANAVPDREGGPERQTVLEPRRRARLDHDWAMVLDGGWFASTPEEGNRLRWALQSTNVLTLELTVTPSGDQEGSIVGLGEPSRGFDFLLEQAGERLRWRQVVGSRRRAGAVASADLGPLPRRTHHLAVTQQPGQTSLYVDGEPTASSTGIGGDFFHFRSYPLEVGRDWDGRIEGLALYDRILSPDEIREAALRYRQLRERRPAVQRWTVEASLVERTPAPTLEEISPYRDALVVAEYAVRRWSEGEPLGETVRIAEWAWQDGEAVPAAEDARTLVLERFTDNPQLEGVFVADRLPPSESPLLYVVAR